MSVPDDLRPLPTMPYVERPSELALDVEECRTALWASRGNVSAAAKLLKISPSRLRSFVKNSPRLKSEQDEARQQLVDMSEDVAYDALLDATDPSRQDAMARFIMTNLGQDRGYGKNGGVSLNLPKGNISITWADGTDLNGAANSARVIEGSVADG